MFLFYKKIWMGNIVREKRGNQWKMFLVCVAFVYGVR